MGVSYYVGVSHVVCNYMFYVLHVCMLYYNIITYYYVCCIRLVVGIIEGQ